MIIIEEKKKKNILFSFNKFLFLYFFITLIIGLILAGFIFNSYTFSKAKNTFLDYFSKAGRYEYLYLPNITIKALKSNFDKINKINLEIKLDNILIIENFRKNPKKVKSSEDFLKNLFHFLNSEFVNCNTYIMNKAALNYCKTGIENVN